MSGRGKVYNRIFNEEEWEKVNHENKLMIDDFLEEYRQRKIKDSTIKQYHNDLRIVMIYILRKLGNRPIIELNKKDFRRFSLYLTNDLKVSNARSNRLMSAVRSQDAVLFMVMFDSAARRNEVFQIEKNGILEGNRANEVVGKRGKKYRPVYLDDTKELIRQYLEERGEDNIDSLWITGKGENKKPITSDTIYNRIVYMSKILSEIEGKKIEFFPHSMRHSRIECLLQGHDTRILDENGKPKKFSLEEVQLFVNHSDPKTTQSYAKDHSEEIVDNMFGF